jgi:hypothetical protein
MHACHTSTRLSPSSVMFVAMYVLTTMLPTRSYLRHLPEGLSKTRQLLQKEAGVSYPVQAAGPHRHLAAEGAWRHRVCQQAQHIGHCLANLQQHQNKLNILNSLLFVTRLRNNASDAHAVVKNPYTATINNGTTSGCC